MARIYCILACQDHPTNGWTGETRELSTPSCPYRDDGAHGHNGIGVPTRGR